MRRRLRALLAGALMVGGTGTAAHGVFIPLKAWLAQVLLDTAWENRRPGEAAPRPWPWADTRPVARIRQSRLTVGQVVLQGASGRVLAFGPGHVTGSALPGQAGNVVISGHRDTHFRWLRDLRIGDRLLLEVDDGRTLDFAVVHAAIHHETEVGLLDPLAGRQLRLITCYPFDAVDPGTPLRYVVTALPTTAM